jgi:hypothetical protein
MPRLQISHLIAPIAEIAFIILGFTVLAPAQQTIGAKAGGIKYVLGEVFLNGTPLQLPKGSSVQMENGQVLSTKKGYVELLLAPSAYLRLGADALLRMRQNKLKDVQLELTQGSALVEILATIKANPIKVHVSKSVIEMKKTGLYRVDSIPGELRVHGGNALVKSLGKKINMKRGGMVHLDGELRLEKFDPKTIDVLHLWAAQRSYELCTANIFISKQGHMEQLTWRPTPEGGLKNDNYRLRFPVNADWLKYWQGQADYRNKLARALNRELQGIATPILDPETKRLMYPQSQAAQEQIRLNNAKYEQIRQQNNSQLPPQFQPQQ